MVVSLSHAFDAARPAEATGGTPRCLDVTPDTTFQHDNQAVMQPNSLDLRELGGLSQLRRMSLLWPELSVTEQHAWLKSRKIMLPPCEIGKPEVALLPGGAVALRGPNEMLVCDPVEAAIFNQAEVKQLRRLLRGRGDITTLLHISGGVMLHSRVPKQLPPHAVWIVPNQ